MVAETNRTYGSSRNGSVEIQEQEESGSSINSAVESQCPAIRPTGV